ncbi:MAG: chemotaxis response regulator protein-glutamate methylesterase [Devosia sp.]|nr:chemotaxis response regulator protein-glutamate methylesterase [Devosia sp.]
MAASGRTRVLIVDDSAVMRSLLRSVVNSGAGLEVAGTAADGASALSALALERHDLVLLDVEMPVMDGLDTLRKLRERGHKMPVIMCSSLTQRGAKVTIEALACGASDYVAKPSGQAGREEGMRALAQDLIPKIHALTHAPAHALAVPMQQPSVFPAASRLAPPPGAQFLPAAAPAVVAIGVSTGGPAALDVVLPELPANFPLPVLVVQHMPEVFTCLFAERLSRRCRLRVCEASEGAPAIPGIIYIARGNWHMETLAAARTGSPATLHLSQDPPENHCRPAVDALFRSVARVYGPAVLAVVLTGMGCDGLAGSRIVRAQGGSVLAQDQASSTVWGMPGAVAQAGLAHKVLPLVAIVPEILRMTGRAAPATAESHILARMAV